MPLKKKRQMYAKAYGMGDVKVGLITGQYPNRPILGRIR